LAADGARRLGKTGLNPFQGLLLSRELAGCPLIANRL
jgi:hypothetical protein